MVPSLFGCESHPREQRARGKLEKVSIESARSKDPCRRSNKLLAASPVPKPPPRRPNIQERISMIDMARTHHTGRVPKGGRPLPGLATPTPPTRRSLRALFMAGAGWSKTTCKMPYRDVYDPPLTVTLLDENRW
jgi:hypothetical protein